MRLPDLILASGSPRRKKLMQLFNRPFTVKPSDVSEHHNANDHPWKIVQTLALRKASDIAGNHSHAVVIGADTIVVHNGQILEKPESPDHARTMLQLLSNQTHRVLTGIALAKTDDHCTITDKQTFYETTLVTFGPLGQTEIDEYIASGSPMDKAGSYGIQDNFGAFFVKRIEGDYYNIVGLPLHALNERLQVFAPELFN